MVSRFSVAALISLAFGSAASDDDTRPERVADVLLRRLDSDADLARVVERLAAACRRRASCARQLQQMTPSGAAPELVDVGAGADDEPPEVRGMDVVRMAGGMRLLFGTPFYSATLDGHEGINRGLARLLAAERRGRTSPWSRSLTGNGFRTDDGFLQRREPSITQLRARLTEHVSEIVQYGQPRCTRPTASRAPGSARADSARARARHPPSNPHRARAPAGGCASRPST